MGPIDLTGPKTYREYLSRLEGTPLPLNTAAMVGTGTVKICVKGFFRSTIYKEGIRYRPFHY